MFSTACREKAFRPLMETLMSSDIEFELSSQVVVCGYKSAHQSDTTLLEEQIYEWHFLKILSVKRLRKKRNSFRWEFLNLWSESFLTKPTYCYHLMRIMFNFRFRWQKPGDPTRLRIACAWAAPLSCNDILLFTTNSLSFRVWSGGKSDSTFHIDWVEILKDI